MCSIIDLTLSSRSISCSELGVSEVDLSNGEKMFCGYVRDRTQERMDKQNLRRQEAVIKDKFFLSVDPADARGSQKRFISRCTR